MSDPSRLPAPPPPYVAVEGGGGAGGGYGTNNGAATAPSSLDTSLSGFVTPASSVGAGPAGPHQQHDAFHSLQDSRRSSVTASPSSAQGGSGSSGSGGTSGGNPPPKVPSLSRRFDEASLGNGGGTAAGGGPSPRPSSALGEADSAAGEGREGLRPMMSRSSSRDGRLSARDVRSQAGGAGHGERDRDVYAPDTGSPADGRSRSHSSSNNVNAAANSLPPPHPPPVGRSPSQQSVGSSVQQPQARPPSNHALSNGVASPTSTGSSNRLSSQQQQQPPAESPLRNIPKAFRFPLIGPAEMAAPRHDPRLFYAKGHVPASGEFITLPYTAAGAWEPDAAADGLEEKVVKLLNNGGFTDVYLMAHDYLDSPLQAWEASGRYFGEYHHKVVSAEREAWAQQAGSKQQPQQQQQQPLYLSLLWGSVAPGVPWWAYREVVDRDVPLPPDAPASPASRSLAGNGGDVPLVLPSVMAEALDLDWAQRDEASGELPPGAPTPDWDLLQHLLVDKHGNIRTGPHFDKLHRVELTDLLLAYMDHPDDPTWHAAARVVRAELAGPVGRAPVPLDRFLGAVATRWRRLVSQRTSRDESDAMRDDPPSTFNAAALLHAVYVRMQEQRARDVGAADGGPAKLLQRLLSVASVAGARVHLIGHSYGAALLLSALKHMKGSTSLGAHSLLLIQPAVSRWAFSRGLPKDVTLPGLAAAPGSAAHAAAVAAAEAAVAPGEFASVAARITTPIVATYADDDETLMLYYGAAFVERDAADLARGLAVEQELHPEVYGTPKSPKSPKGGGGGGGGVGRVPAGVKPVPPTPGLLGWDLNGMAPREGARSAFAALGAHGPDDDNSSTAGGSSSSNSSSGVGAEAGTHTVPPVKAVRLPWRPRGQPYNDPAATGARLVGVKGYWTAAAVEEEPWSGWLGDTLLWLQLCATEGRFGAAAGPPAPAAAPSTAPAAAAATATATAAAATSGRTLPSAHSSRQALAIPEDDTLPNGLDLDSHSQADSEDALTPISDAPVAGARRDVFLDVPMDSPATGGSSRGVGLGSSSSSRDLASGGSSRQLDSDGTERQRAQRVKIADLPSAPSQLEMVSAAARALKGTGAKEERARYGGAAAEVHH